MGLSAGWFGKILLKWMMEITPIYGIPHIISYHDLSWGLKWVVHEQPIMLFDSKVVSNMPRETLNCLGRHELGMNQNL